MPRPSHLHCHHYPHAGWIKAQMDMPNHAMTTPSFCSSRCLWIFSIKSIYISSFQDWGLNATCLSSSVSERQRPYLIGPILLLYKSLMPLKWAEFSLICYHQEQDWKNCPNNLLELEHISVTLKWTQSNWVHRLNLLNQPPNLADNFYQLFSPCLLWPIREPLAWQKPTLARVSFCAGSPCFWDSRLCFFNGVCV